MNEQKWIVLAGEEAGPKSNKMGGIWNVIDAEAVTLAELISSGKIDADKNTKILVCGPYYGYSGADWHKSLNRITDVSNMEPLDISGDFATSLKIIENEGIKVVTGSRKVQGVEIGYLLFDTTKCDTVITEYNGVRMTMGNKVKSEAFELLGIDSLHYENMGNGSEYLHYMYLSYAISELIRAIITLSLSKAKRYDDKAVSDFALSLMPQTCVSLHCHEFGAFYAIARLKKMGLPISTIATLHATLPGRSAGYKSIEKITHNDSSWPSEVPINFAALEVLAKYADVVTAVGDSTLKEAQLFYGINGIVVRNGVDTLPELHIDWDKKKKSRNKLQLYLSKYMLKVYGGEPIPPEKIIPMFTISRTELDNKGYPDLLDALVIQDRILKNSMLSGTLDDGIRVICLLVTAHGPKQSVPEGFPVNLPNELLIGEEIHLQNMVKEHKLHPKRLITGERVVSAMLYPQWIGPNDGGFGMTSEEFMSGTVCGIFPSRYDPFLLTGLEAGKVATPSIVSRVCGFSDALNSIERLVDGMGGVVVVDNIDLSYTEMIADYALAMEYFVRTYVGDKVKYKLLCHEAYLLAKEMNWDEPVQRYYEILARDVCGKK